MHLLWSVHRPDTFLFPVRFPWSLSPSCGQFLFTGVALHQLQYEDVRLSFTQYQIVLHLQVVECCLKLFLRLSLIVCICACCSLAVCQKTLLPGPRWTSSSPAWPHLPSSVTTYLVPLIKLFVLSTHLSVSASRSHSVILNISKTPMIR